MSGVAQKRVVDFLNPDQVSVISGDQPVYALGKKFNGCIQVIMMILRG